MNKNLRFKSITEYKSVNKINIDKVIKKSFDKSGVLVYKEKNLYLVILYTPIGQNGKGGHTHHDLLSYELWLDGVCLQRDAGTYLYTAMPQMRNLFKSAKYHNGPCVFEKENWGNNSYRELFDLENKGKIIRSYGGVNKQTFIMEKEELFVRRTFEIMQNGLVIIDESNMKLIKPERTYISNGYGKLCLDVKK